MSKTYSSFNIFKALQVIPMCTLSLEALPYRKSLNNNKRVIQLAVSYVLESTGNGKLRKIHMIRQGRNNIDLRRDVCPPKKISVTI